MEKSGDETIKKAERIKSRNLINKRLLGTSVVSPEQETNSTRVVTQPL